MATITFPSSPKPSTMAWRLVQPAQQNVSQWTGARQVLASGRGWWECSLSLPPIVGETAVNSWRAFMAQARGAANDFQVPVNEIAQSALANVARINGAGQTGRSLATDGWPVSTTVLSAGQFLTINNQLVQLTANITSNASGQATISFEPAIRVSPADNAIIEYKNPYALMYFVEDPGYSVEPGLVYSLAFNLRESF
jgi:hypothetical protein